MLIGIGVAINYILKWYLFKNNATEKQKMVLFWVCFLLVLGLDQLRFHYGSTTIGSFMQRGVDYNVNYYVNTESGIGIATLLVDNEDEYTRVYLERITFSNGTKVNFKYQDSDIYNEVDFDHSSYVSDDKHREWKVTLTEDKAN
jgi:hypothetical protein